MEGAQVWDLALRCASQMRLGMGGPVGLDLGAVLAMGQALGVPALAVAEMMPEIERRFIAALNRGDGDGD